MIELVVGENQLVARWVALAMREPSYLRGFGNCTAIGVMEDGEMIGGTVFHNYEPEADVIEMSSAATSPRWLAPKMVRAIFEYVFDQLQCQTVVMRVRERNQRMVRIAERFGFKGVLLPRLAGRDQGIWVFTMTDDQWRDHPVNRRGAA